MKRLKIIKDNLLTLKRLFEKFIRNCKIKDLYKYTITYYKKSFNYFIRYLKIEYDNPEDIVIKYINREVVDDFIYWLKDTYNMKNITVNTRIRGARAFLYYLIKRKYLYLIKINY